ncbi:daptide biosynthesis RiPP recognition protein [Streptomyces nitrosporeus]|uniref:daptide biosynthesis RiPP recognition protein n=1 Tax=Streptomyces nitrosporeus TaxID=28894 RepID=UPI00167E416C|nr:daptide biosynthesis RiPP recognition protein [Streptomyces nitrosporeus]
MTHSSAKAHALQWGTGRPVSALSARPPYTSTVVLEDASHLDALLGSGVAGPGTTVLVPGDEPSAEPVRHEPTGAEIITWQGSLGEPGAEAGLHPDFYLQVQAYSITPYLSVLGPTLVRITEEADFQAYLDDAGRALDQGEFSEYLTHPAVQLGDLSALGGGPGEDGPGLRLYVAADGTVSVSPGGAPLGPVGTPRDELHRAWQEFPDALGAVPDSASRARELASRPWTGRYLAALGAVREAVTRGMEQPRVSGFGGRMTEALNGFAEPFDRSATAPLLLHNGERALIHHPVDRRTVALSTDAALAAEALLVTGSAQEAARYAAPDTVDAVAAYFAGIGLPLTESAEPRTVTEEVNA